MTSGLGLMSAGVAVDRDLVLQMGAAPLDPGSEGLAALAPSIKRLAGGLETGRRVVFLGSLNPRRYLAALLPVLGDRLFAPARFKSMGQMQRGSLLLRCVQEDQELEYSGVRELLSELSTPSHSKRRS